MFYEAACRQISQKGLEEQFKNGDYFQNGVSIGLWEDIWLGVSPLATQKSSSYNK
jgi:hypothetical protein